MAAKKTLDQATIFKLFGRFIGETQSGKRLKKDGKKIRHGTAENYHYTYKLLEEFCAEKNFELNFPIVTKLGKRDFETARKYWKKFYTTFTDYLYKDCDYYDNYVGLVIKSFRSFINYLKVEKNLDVGSFHRSFYVPHEEIPIIALTPDQMNYLINNPELEKKLPSHLLHIKDRFVFGCTVALRQADILALTWQNVHKENNAWYLRVRSLKTNTFTSVKLPGYAVDILNKYKTRRNTLFPPISKGRFNVCLKELGKHLDYDESIIKTREKRGQRHIIYKDPKKKTHHTLADLITTHTMRRTGITTMLRLGMPDYLVRKVSGHAANSKEFYRYVQLAQNFLDEKTDEMFSKLTQIA
jgi:integrase